MGWLADETGLGKCAANYAPLTPLAHLQRAVDAQQQGDWLTRQYHEQTITDLNAVIELAYRVASH